MHSAKDVPADRFFAMTRLDETRARAQLAKKAGAALPAVTHVAVWGNHSSTMFPDFSNARIHGKPATDVISDQAWFKDTFLPVIQQRGAAIIKTRGASSAASAAHSVVETVRALTTATAPGDFFSVGVCSDGSYGIEPGLIFSYPTRSDGRNWSIVPGLNLDAYARAKIAASEAELKEEKSMVAELLG
jgi:malate dehydrogenase